MPPRTVFSCTFLHNAHPIAYWGAAHPILPYSVFFAFTMASVSNTTIRGYDLVAIPYIAALFPALQNHIMYQTNPRFRFVSVPFVAAVLVVAVRELANQLADEISHPPGGIRRSKGQKSTMICYIFPCHHACSHALRCAPIHQPRVPPDAPTAGWNQNHPWGRSILSRISIAALTSCAPSSSIRASNSSLDMRL